MKITKVTKPGNYPLLILECQAEVDNCAEKWHFSKFKLVEGLKVGRTRPPRLPRAKIHKIKKKFFNLLKNFKSYEVLSFAKFELEEQTQKTWWTS